VPGLTPANSDKNSSGLMRLFTRKTNKLQPKFEMTGGCSWRMRLTTQDNTRWHHKPCSDQPRHTTDVASHDQPVLDGHACCRWQCPRIRVYASSCLVTSEAASHGVLLQEYLSANHPTLTLSLNPQPNPDLTIEPGEALTPALISLPDSRP